MILLSKMALNRHPPAGFQFHLHGLSIFGTGFGLH